MEKEKPLTENQKILMTLSGEESCRDWRESLGDERLRLSRVLIKKLIRTNEKKTLDIVAEYFGVRLEWEDEDEDRG